MKATRFIPVVISMGLTILLFQFLKIQPVKSQSDSATGLPVWQQSNSDGFGDSMNQMVPSLAVFNNVLYAGTAYDTGGASSSRIWRTSDGKNWELAGSDLGVGAAHLIEYKNYLYVGTFDGRISRTPDGIAWTPVITDGFGNPDLGIARFSMYSDTLYVGTWSPVGTELWRTSNGLNWSQFGMDGYGNPNNDGAIASEIFNGELYLGNWNKTSGAQLWRTDGITLTQVISDGFGSIDNMAVSSLAAFGGNLYAGLYNQNGVQVWRSPDGNAWTRVVSDGFGNSNTNEENALEVFDGFLYLVVSNKVTGMEVWRTSDGQDWHQVGFSGFGDSGNGWLFYDSATTVFKGSLFIGTNNFNTGGEVWRILQEQLYLPLIPKDL